MGPPMNDSEEAPEDEEAAAEASGSADWLRFGRQGAGRRDVDPLVRLLVENARDLVYRFRFDPEPAFEYVSPAARAMTGYEPQEFYEDPDLFLSIVHPDDRERFEAYLRGRIRSDVPLQVRWMRKDGAVLHVDARFVPVRDAKKNLIAIEAVVRNVSERHMAEHAFKRYSEQLEEAQHLAHLGTWIWDVASDQVLWSQELYRIYGVDAESFEATYDAFLDLVHPEDRERVDRDVENAFEKKGDFEFQHRIVRPDGTVRWLIGRGRCVVGDDGEVAQMIGTGQDVTDLKQADRKFRLALEAAPDAMLIADAQGRITVANTQAERMFGYPRDELVGQTVEKLIPERLAASHVAYRKEYMEEPEIRPMGAGRELKALHKDGHEIPVEISLSPLDLDGETQVIATVRDITERREHERKEREAERQAGEAERQKQLHQMKMRFVTMAAHELGNPITPVQLQLHLLRTLPNQNLSADQRHAIKILERNIDRMARLIHDLLDAAKEEAGHLKITRQPVDLDLMVEEALASVVPQAKRQEVTMEARPSTGVVVSADAGRIEEVLYNLLSNAIKFTPRGGHVTVETGQDGQQAFVRVSDTGQGLEPDQVKELFEPFSRPIEKMEADPGGSGLGLYVSRLIVEKHGGKIWADSAGPGRGTTFEFTLPITVSEKAHALRILVVEQDESDARKTRESLDQMPVPHEIMMLRDGAEALDWLEEAESHPERGDRPDLLVVDLDLPSGGGDRMLSRIREDPSLKDLPVIAISSAGDERSKLQGYQLDASGFLQKPVAVDELRMLLQSLRLL